MQHPHTVTFFPLGARVTLDLLAGHGTADGELIGIGRRYLVIRLDGGRIVRRVQPSWITRQLKIKGKLT
jgi:hypothetical protein